MKKLVKVSILFGIAALLMLMVFGSAAAEIVPEFEPGGEGEVEAEPEVAEPVEEEPGNRTVWVEVVYYPGPDTEGTVMTILNHVPDEAYGWASDGMAHALEVAWPDEPLMGAEEMDPNL